VSTYYILCISWIIKCLIIIDARCKHEGPDYLLGPLSLLFIGAVVLYPGVKWRDMKLTTHLQLMHAEVKNDWSSSTS